MDELTLQVSERMAKTIASLKENFTILRTGRANPSMLDKVQADYYGDKILINQISSITSPEPRQILIKPYDKNDCKAIVSAISASDLGVNPIVDGDKIRIIIAPLTEETRKDIVKKAKAMAEEAKISLRNIRREYLDFLKEDEGYSDDLKKRIQDEIQKVVDEKVGDIEKLLAAKEKEILTI